MDELTYQRDRPVVRSGTQTLSRGLEVLQYVARGISTPKALAQTMQLPRSTIARTLASLVREGYLHKVPYRGYFLGARLIELGERAAEQQPLVDIARPFLEALANDTRDTVHFGVLDGSDVLYLCKLAGKRSLEMRSRSGGRMPALATAMGKAMLASRDPASWPSYHASLQRHHSPADDAPPVKTFAELHRDLIESDERGWSYDWEENEYGIRCVSAAVMNHADLSIAAVSVTSVISFMPEQRMRALGGQVKRTADAIARALSCRA